MRFPFAHRLLAGLLLFGALIPVAEAAEVDDRINQARVFVRNGWHADAIAELQAAVATDAGASSYEAHKMLAMVLREQRMMEEAARWARVAAQLAMNPADAEEMERIAGEIDATYGVAVITAPYSGMTSALTIERTSPLLDPQLRSHIEVLAERHSTPSPLPARLALPEGSYTINSQVVEVKAGEESSTQLPIGAIESRGLTALQVSRLEFGIGTGVLVSPDVLNLRPGLEMEVAVTQPIGAWLVGASFDWSRRSFSVVGSATEEAPLAFDVGARIGREVMLGGPLALRASLGYRYGSLPGVEMACDSASELDPFSEPYACHVGDEENPDLHVYGVAATHTPFAEFAMDFRKAGVTTSSGVGVKINAGYAMGSLRSPGTATLLDDGAELSFDVAEPAIGGVVVRVMAHLSYAL